MRKFLIILSIGVLIFLVYGFIKGNNFVSKEVDFVSYNKVDELNIISWNIQNFGRSKMSNDSVMIFISEVVKGYDIVAIQEVSVSKFGLQAIMRLDNLLDSSGHSWDYIISDATSGDGSEKYAYLFKTDRVRLLSHSLEESLDSVIDREPYMAKFSFRRRHYILGNVHLVPIGKNPSLEVKELVSLGKKYKSKRFIMMGDFNLSESDDSFDVMKGWSVSVLKGERTSLKMKEGSDWLNKEYDNFFVSKEIEVGSSGVIHFYKNFGSLREARKVSDHCPIFISIKR
jgi:endonuclease/exonuclease/phosphatase family metal-dependent hydrolase